MGSETSAEPVEAFADHRAVSIVSQGAGCRASQDELLSGPSDVALASVALAEIEVEARGQASRRGDPDRAQIVLVDLGELLQGDLVPPHLIGQVRLKVSEVVGQDAALGVFLRAAGFPQGAQPRGSLARILTEHGGQGGGDVVPISHGLTLGPGPRRRLV